MDAQAFYESLGARRAGGAPVAAPGGIATRIVGSPAKLRYAWQEPGVLLERAQAIGYGA